MGGEVFVWTDHYCFADQCGVSSGPIPIAAALYPREVDEQFEASTLGVTFPYTLVAAGSWWNWDPTVDPTSSEFKAAILEANSALVKDGIKVCPSECGLLPSTGMGCNETHRCGKPYI